jgi:hypothetical protein
MGKEQKSKAWLQRDNPVSSQVLITYKVVFFKLHLFTAVVENRSNISQLPQGRLNSLNFLKVD